MIDLDALDEWILKWPHAPMPASMREDLRASLAELRTSREVVEAVRALNAWERPRPAISKRRDDRKFKYELEDDLRTALADYEALK